MPNLNTLTRNDLKKIAKELKIKGFATAKKDALIVAINAAVEADESLLETVQELFDQIDGEKPVKSDPAHPSRGIKELTFNGKTQSITAWAAEVGLNRPALYDRINRHGWSTEEALTIPAGERRKKPVAEGQVSMDEVEEAEE